SGCLPGVTRAAILELAAEIGLKCIETTLRPADLAAADEMFFCNTLMECLPVAELDGRRYAGAPGEVTRRVEKELRELVEREVGSRPTGGLRPPLARKDELAFQDSDRRIA
ncbi:MAG: aminotransferase class IV, partial [Planctomycetes bacterium]|nr:aminotransferase class IV [Planctomycetota bacterium]